MKLLSFVMAMGFAGSVFAAGFDSDLPNLRRGLKSHGIEVQDFDSLRNIGPGVESKELTASQTPWAANYYPLCYGGMNWQWQKGTKTTEKDLIYNRVSGGPDAIKQFLKDNSAELAKLSAAEKYDISRGDYSFTFSRYQWRVQGPAVADASCWEGFCNGVRAAGIALEEPVKSAVVNGVPFEPADVKALAGYAYYRVQDSTYSRIGNRSSGELDDRPDPAIFLMALRAFGSAGKAFIFDGKASNQVWNESAVGYSIDIVESAPGKVKVTFKVKYLGEIAAERGNRETRTAVASGEITRTTNWVAEIDVKDGKAIGGQWMGSDGPGQAWFFGGRGANSNIDIDHVESLVAATSASGHAFAPPAEVVPPEPAAPPVTPAPPVVTPDQPTAPGEPTTTPPAVDPAQPTAPVAPTAPAPASGRVRGGW